MDDLFHSTPAAPLASMAREHSGCEVWEQDFLALELPAEHFDGIFANVDAQTPKLKANLIEHEAQARSNVDMMTLRRDVELPLAPAVTVKPVTLRTTLPWFGEVHGVKVVSIG